MIGNEQNRGPSTADNFWYAMAVPKKRCHDAVHVVKKKFLNGRTAGRMRNIGGAYNITGGGRGGNCYMNFLFYVPLLCIASTGM